MPALVAGIHVSPRDKTWVAGTSPAKTSGYRPVKAGLRFSMKAVRPSI
jgi:hypothetical protein